MATGEAMYPLVLVSEVTHFRKITTHKTKLSHFFIFNLTLSESSNYNKKDIATNFFA